MSTTPNAATPTDFTAAPRSFLRRWTGADEIAHLITLIAAATLLLIAALLVYQLWILSAESRAKFGWSFFVTKTWDPVSGDFGALPFIYGTLVTSAVALIIAVGKIAISLPSAYAVVFFRFPLRKACFWAIFVTLMLPVEVRIIPTYQIVSDMGLIDRYAGLSLPLVASATATLLFRQFFLTIPDELVEAAKIDGAGPLRFFVDTVIPLSRTNIAAMFVILFIYGWNQYLWPLLVTNTPSMTTIIIGMRQMIGNGDTRPNGRS